MKCQSVAGSHPSDHRAPEGSLPVIRIARVPPWRIDARSIRGARCGANPIPAPNELDRGSRTDPTLAPNELRRRVLTRGGIEGRLAPDLLRESQDQGRAGATKAPHKARAA